MDIITLALAKKMINSQKDAYVFNSVEELQDFINSSKDSLKIGDKFYITDPNSPDYWWDGTTLQEEKVKIDLSNLATKEELNTKQNILTEEDKQELVQKVITALPKYNGETSDKS